jgi:hypothetical protein
MVLPHDATLPEIENIVRAQIDADIILTETGYFMTAVEQSAEHLVEQFGYQLWQRRDGVVITGLPTAGLARKLDALEGAGFILAIVGRRPSRHQSRSMLYVTGDPRGAPVHRTAADAIGLTRAHAKGEEVRPDSTAAPSPAAEHQELRDPRTAPEAIYCADRLLDLRIELLMSVWQQFVGMRDPNVFRSLFLCERLQREAQQMARRPVRRRRDGDEIWTAELDRHVIEWFVSGRLLAEIARSVDRPTSVTAERLVALEYPAGLWPAWDDQARSRRDEAIDEGRGLAELAQTLRRSPWDIIDSLGSASRSIYHPETSTVGPGQIASED